MLLEKREYNTICIGSIQKETFTAITYMNLTRRVAHYFLVKDHQACSERIYCRKPEVLSRKSENCSQKINLT
ncbi:hypothetical protein BpHYR1_013417 [Brachionus plicatilis]|uniref:Uncharacterized protein n=1 Tax=Brachionus plicatilis TaxID=10195 RepID=A0A3M7R8F7_BRAPC|nr:hypothetical protein BpHYR1_013417 [Brachionus plicatilis]